MAVAHRVAASAITATGALQTTLSITTPTGVVAGDVMEITLGLGGGSNNPDTSLTEPSGVLALTRVRRDDSGTAYARIVYWKVVSAAEATTPETYTWSWTTASNAVVGIEVRSGVDTTAPVGTVHSAQLNASSVSAVAPAVTPSADGSGIGYSVVGGGQFTMTAAPTDMVEQYDVFTNGGSVNRFAVGAEQVLVGGSGVSTGTRTGTMSNAAGTLAGLTAFKPGATGPVAQYARPASDISAGSWTPSTGGVLYAMLDETTASDADSIQSGTLTTIADVSEVALGSVSDPIASTGHVIRYRYAKDSAGGDVVNLTVGLYQGATLIASAMHTDISDVVTVGTFTLTAAQSDSLNNYSDLRLRFSAVKA